LGAKQTHIGLSNLAHFRQAATGDAQGALVESHGNGVSDYSVACHYAKGRNYPADVSVGE
jgi:hypothetical protein